MVPARVLGLPSSAGHGASFGEALGWLWKALEASRRVLGPAYPSNPVRRMYAQLLVRAAKEGLPRSSSKTPAEFLTQLAATWPEGSQHFIALTNAYIRCRYGEARFQEQQIAQIKEHWRAVRSIMLGPGAPRNTLLQRPLRGQ